MSDYDCFSQDELMALAELDMSRESYEAALQKLKAMQVRGDVPESYHATLGRLYASIGLLARARAQFLKCLERNPAAVHERFQLGMVERDLGNMIKAQQIWDELLEDSPDYPPALFYKAASFVDVEEYRSAVPLLQRLKETADETNEFFVRGSELLERLNLQ